MNTPHDILYIIPRPEIGGAERQLLMLMQGLDRTQYRPHVVCLDGGGSLLDEYREATESCLVINRSKPFDLRALTALRTHISNLQPALVHTWLYIANLYGSVATRTSTNVPVIVSQRGLGIDPQHSKLKTWKMRIFNRLVARLCDRLLVNAQAVTEPMYQVGFSPEKTQVIYNGLNLDIHVTTQQQNDLRQELGIQPDETVLAAIARIDPKKDLETMLRAFAIVHNHNPKTRLLIAGGGFSDYQKKLDHLAEELNIQNGVSFLGFRNDPQVILSICNISLLSSLTEGLPNAILESMALGKPVVATKVGGVPELITDGEHGYLVAKGDHEQFACSILNLNPERAQEMGLAAKEKAQKQFGRQTMIDNTTNVYRQLLDEDPISLNTPLPQKKTVSGR
ncbi:MAG: glycosyltransferase involved in cell wall biosynthesis [Candidatus Latescibacterota bacterium]|jgi:glycosyltransferase involved in cell wall biosynthesis